jgi:hypothetical protein
MNGLLKINNSAYFWTLCILSGLFVFLSKQFLYTDQLYYSAFGEQFTSGQIQKLLTYQNETWRQILGYCLIPLIIIIRVVYTSFCLNVGNLVNETHWKYKSLYNIALKSDIVFLFSQISNFYYYTGSSNYKTIEDLGVNCVSFLKIVGKENIPAWLVLAYNSINLFELIYVILLILFIKNCFHITFGKSTVFVLLTYVIGNYFYIVAMTFLYLSFG